MSSGFSVLSMLLTNRDSDVGGASLWWWRWLWIASSALLMMFALTGSRMDEYLFCMIMFLSPSSR